MIHTYEIQSDMTPILSHDAQQFRNSLPDFETPSCIRCEHERAGFFSSPMALSNTGTHLLPVHRTRPAEGLQTTRLAVLALHFASLTFKAEISTTTFVFFQNLIFAATCKCPYLLRCTAVLSCRKAVFVCYMFVAQNLHLVQNQIRLALRGMAYFKTLNLLSDLFCFPAWTTDL